MSTTPETDSLLAELYERSSIVAELDGPQIEAWVSGLFVLFGPEVSANAFVSHCAAQKSPAGAVVCAALAELSTGLDDQVAAFARDAVDESLLPASAAEIGTSQVAQAWSVEAPFGKSIVLGYENPMGAVDESTESEPSDRRHSIMVEIGEDAMLTDLQLAGPAQDMIADAKSSEERVVVRDLDVDDAMALIAAAWPAADGDAAALGPGMGANQQFVRRRVFVATGQVLPTVAIEERAIDIRRGLDDEEFAQANQAALSTLRSAVATAGDVTPGDDASPAVEAWVGVIRGDGGELSTRERDALLWLEWADWLGVGIGLLRSGVDSPVTGSAFVDHVNRCPEVSSSVTKADRDYAEWAFEVAIDLLADVGLVADARLTQAGYDTLGVAMIAAWS